METETDEQQCHYKITRRGYRTLIYSGYNYMRNRQRGNKEYWVCSRRPRCLGKAVTVDGLITQLSGGHNHPPYSAEINHSGNGRYFQTEYDELENDSKQTVRLMIDSLERGNAGVNVTAPGTSVGSDSIRPQVSVLPKIKNEAEDGNEIFYSEKGNLGFASAKESDHNAQPLSWNENVHHVELEVENNTNSENLENHLNGSVTNKPNENKNPEPQVEPVYEHHVDGMYFDGQKWDVENKASRVYRPGKRLDPYPVLMNVGNMKGIRQGIKSVNSNSNQFSNYANQRRRTAYLQRKNKGSFRDFNLHYRRGRGELPANHINRRVNYVQMDNYSDNDILPFEEYPESSSSCHCCCHRNNSSNCSNTSPGTMSNLRLTKPAPEWKGTAVVNNEFKDISLADYKGKYLVFFFYPLDFTFVCPTEIIAFSDRVEEFRAVNCEVVACSTDSHFSHLAWVNTPRKQGGLGNMKIPLLADKTCEISRAYGVLKEDEGIAFRGLFVIDGKGNLRQITVNDLPVGRSVDETLRLVQAFQFTDKHGEVCPAGWKPGSDTMKPDPKGSQSFFQKHN